MDKPIIKTNHRYRDLFNGCELSEALRLKYFNYLTAEEFAETSLLFFKYRKYWYDLNEFFCTFNTPFNNLPDDSPIKTWDGYQTDSFFFRRASQI